MNPHSLNKLISKQNLGSTQKFSSNIIINPLVDETVDYIAKYLYEYINKDYSNYIEANPGVQKILGDVAIRTYRTCDTYQVSTPEFPLLKVYRTNDSWRDDKLLRTSNISITYSLLVPQQERLMPLLNWVSYEIQKLLLTPSCKVKIDGGVRTQYRTMISEIGQNMFSFLRADISITD
jgi:hypothetical protein